MRDLTLEQASARALLNLANEAITVFDFESFRIVDCNEAAERLFQRSREELRALEDVFVLNVMPDGSEPAFRAVHRKMLEQVAVHGESFSGHFDARRKDGTTVPVFADVCEDSRVTRDGADEHARPPRRAGRRGKVSRHRRERASGHHSRVGGGPPRVSQPGL